MPPPTRFTAHQNSGGSDWYVYDHLRRHSTSGGQPKERAVFLARAQEHQWRQRCDHWIKAERQAQGG